MRVFRILCFHNFVLTHEIAVSFSTLFEVRADLSVAPNDLIQRRTAAGGVFYRLRYHAIVYFGLAEIKAEIAWETKVRGKPHVLQFAE